jgi:signal transduction histidine kinase/CheY-like chemotaxis protein
MTTWLSMDKRLVVLFVALVALVIGRGVMLIVSLSELEKRQAAVERSDDVVALLADYVSQLKDAETGQRGYVLTGDQAYLEPYHTAVQTIRRHDNELKRLAAANPALAPRIVHLQTESAAKLKELADTIAERTNVGFEAARNRVRAGDGKRSMDAIRAEARALVADEKTQRTSLQAEAAGMASQTRSAVVLSTVVMCLLTAIFFIEFRRSSMQRTALMHRAETALHLEATARSAAERASRVKDEFLATLSHELRTPLNAILSWTALMQMESSDPAVFERGLETIERNAKSQARLIDDLLDMSRIVSGKTRLIVTEVDLAPILTSVVDIVRPAADAKNIRLLTAIDSHAGGVSADPERIRQVLWNLLSNAIKFTPKDGRIDVRLEQVDSHVEVVVTDSGQGIDPAFLPHIFDRFRQADSSTTRAHGGLGLGLAIAKHLVELQGGAIRANSAGNGLGASFTVTMPIRGLHTTRTGRDDERNEEGVVPLAADLPGLAGVRILAVDDHSDTLDMVRRLLTRQGALVETAPNVDDALRVFERWRPDVLVVDIGMPGRDGYDLITTVRRQQTERGGSTPAIALTAFARPEDRVRVLAAGFQMHLAKPADPTELVVCVASLARRLNPQH